MTALIRVKKVYIEIETDETDADTEVFSLVNKVWNKSFPRHLGMSCKKTGSHFKYVIQGHPNVLLTITDPPYVLSSK